MQSDSILNARGGNAPHRWGFQIVRTVRGKDESIVWSPVSRSVAGFLTQMGVIEGMTGLSTSRNLEFLPTFTAVRFGSLDTATGGFANPNDPAYGSTAQTFVGRVRYDLYSESFVGAIFTDRLCAQRQPAEGGAQRDLGARVVQPVAGLQHRGRVSRAHRPALDARHVLVPLVAGVGARQLGTAVLLINAGTVFYAGYDDRYRQASRIDLDLNGDGITERPWQSSAFRRENRAIFVKLQHLFRL